jgi:anti-sigma28 factor (negative regulator of flagellin synthesis)
MISNVNSQSNAYVQQLTPKSENSKSVSETQKSEELDKVSTLKEQISNGTYKVDLLKTSQAVMEELI